MGSILGRAGTGDLDGTRLRRLRSCGLASCVAVAAALIAAVPAVAGKTVEKPVNTSLPSISGKAQEGHTLRASAGKWTGGELSYSYDWQRCEPNGSEWECADIPGATGSSYEPHYADVGAELLVVVTAKNSAGETEAVSGKTEAVEGVAPKNTQLPAISGAGANGPEEGQLLSVSTGEWEGTPGSFSYQWERCTKEKQCSTIEGATEAGYHVAGADVGDLLRAAVTDRNVAGVRSATSEYTTTVINGPPVAVGFPQVSGTLREAGTLKATAGVWKGLALEQYTFVWELCSTEGSCSTLAESSTESNTSSYKLGSGAVGNEVRVTVTVRNKVGSASARSVATPQVLSGSANFAVAWGNDWQGQLGTGYEIFEGWVEQPVLDEGSTGITALATQGATTLALHGNGTITAAGGSLYGGQGDGTHTASWEQGVSQVTVKGISEAVQISTGIARLANGDVDAWGPNSYAQLGNGRGGFESYDGENELEPKEVEALHGREVTAVASGEGSRFAILPDGELLAWGKNDDGQLGVEWPASCEKRKTCEPGVKTPPEDRRNNEPIVEPKYKCFFETGWLQCGRRPEPVVKEGHPIKEVVSVSSSGADTFALLEDGEVLSWGDDGFDGLGQALEPGVHTTFSKPAPVMASVTEPLKDVVAIAAGKDGGIALRDNGQLVGWGDDAEGQLGETSEQCKKAKKLYPCDRYATPISGLSGVHITQIAAGAGFSAVLGSEGEVYTVGSNAMGELGRGPGCEEGEGKSEGESKRMGLYQLCYSRHWEAVPGLTDVQAITAATWQVAALVGQEGAPPFPAVAHEAAPQSLKLEWQLPSDEDVESVVYRKWESPEPEGEGGIEGNGNPAREAREEREKEEEEEPRAGESPTVETAPHLKVVEFYEENGKHEEKKAVSAAVGDEVKSTTGNWRGNPQLEYEYQWLRCSPSSGKCEEISGANKPGYEITEQDVGYTIDLEVFAYNGVPPEGVAKAGEPTEVVKGEEEGRKGTATKVETAGSNGLLLSEFDGAQLEPVAYEVKVVAEAAPLGRPKTRKMVLQPQPLP
jgi:alpha-tubulin suppressor-like RCC1 family protein